VWKLRERENEKNDLSQIDQNRSRIGILATKFAIGEMILPSVFRTSAFSHSQDPELTICGQFCCDAQRGIPYNDVVGCDPWIEGTS
jgi:hypothetical protein